MKTFIQSAKAISDPNRVRILMALRGGERCVCRLIELLQLAPSTVSRHLTVLRMAGLIEGRKDGRWMYYRLPQHPAPAAENTLNWVFTSLEHTREVRNDEKRMEKIMLVDVDDLCAIYRK